jgi:hypothetical protein
VLDLLKFYLLFDPMLSSGNILLTMDAEGPPMGNFERFYEQPSEYASFESDHPTKPKERIVRLPGATSTADMRRNDAVLDLVYQAAEMIQGIENHATEAEKTSYQQLQLKQRRIEELEKELRTAQLLISEARTKLKESDAAARDERSRFEAAEERMCELEMRARTAEAQVKENSSALARVEEAIRTQLLVNRLPSKQNGAVALTR